MLSIILIANFDITSAHEIKLLHQRFNTAILQRIEFTGNDVKWGPVPDDKNYFSPRGLMFLHFWAIECKPCIAELPQIKALMSNLKSRNVYPIYIAETENRASITEFYRKHPQLFSVEAEHYYSTSTTNRDFWGVADQPLSLLTDGRTVIYRAFTGSLEGRKAEVDKGVALFLGALRGQGATPAIACPSVKCKDVPAQPGCDLRPVQEEFKRHGVVLADIQRATQELEARQCSTAQSPSSDPDLKAKLKAIQDLLGNNNKAKLQTIEDRLRENNTAVSMLSERLDDDRKNFFRYLLAVVAGGVLVLLGLLLFRRLQRRPPQPPLDGDLTFELCPHRPELEIHGDSEGLRRLSERIALVLTKKHSGLLASREWGGNELSVERRGPKNKLLHKVSVYLGPDPRSTRRLTVELAPERNEVEIHGNALGLSCLIERITQALAQKSSQQLASAEWGGDELGTEKRDAKNELFDRVNICYWPTD